MMGSASLCFFNMEKINVFDVQVLDGRQIRCMSYNKVTYFDLDDICKLCFDSYDLHDVADTKVMSEFLHREGGRYWTEIDGVRQLYRRIECKTCFEVKEDPRDPIFGKHDIKKGDEKENG